MTNVDKVRELASKQEWSAAYAKISEALRKGDFLDAAIRICQSGAEQRLAAMPLKRAFNPNEVRDDKGRWTTNGNGERKSSATNTPSVGWCKIVKQLCIVEATDTLQTSDYGFQFWNAMNACMDRHGCLGVA